VRPSARRAVDSAPVPLPEGSSVVRQLAHVVVVLAVAGPRPG
jgi:hypothetical protein